MFNINFLTLLKINKKVLSVQTERKYEHKHIDIYEELIEC